MHRADCNPDLIEPRRTSHGCVRSPHASQHGTLTGSVAVAPCRIGLSRGRLALGSHMLVVSLILWVIGHPGAT